MRKSFNPVLAGSLIVFAILALVAASTIFGLDRFYSKSSSRQVSIAKKAIQKAAVECYALEGSYPPDLQYLVKNYGIVLDEKKYVYHYEAFASNVAPQIDVLEIYSKGR